MIGGRLIILFVLCIFYSLLANAEESTGGLLFTSSKEKIDKRTSLVLFGDKIQKFENAFSIGFDLSIWDSSQFGHIFHIINNRKQEVEFVFVNFYGTDSMYLDFHSPITHKSVQIPITQEDIDKKTTLNFKLFFDLKEDLVNIAIGDTVYTCHPVGLENPLKLQFAFGLYGLNLDVPQMLIKNLHIQKEKGKSFFFPLDESQGEFAYDKTGKIKAPVKNSGWIVDKHFYWQSKIQFTFVEKADVSYNETNNCILISCKDSVIYFFPRYDKMQVHKSDSCNIFSDMHFESNSLHNNIFSSSTGNMYRFGGYSNHSYSNKISIYNETTGEWDIVDFEGDSIMPRIHSAIGEGVGPDEKLLFGGFGNETGKQEHGGHNLYDLHVLDLNNKTITRLWRILENPEMEFIPGSNLILSKDKKYFYALCYAHHIPKTVGYLYRFNLQNGVYDIMSDSISFTSEDMNTSVNLFYNNDINEFYAVIRDLSDENENRVHIYSLLSPPISKTTLENYSVHSQNSYVWMIICAIVLSLLSTGVYILWYFVFKKKKEKTKKELVEMLHSSHKNENIKKQKHSALYIFGNFTVYDRKGMDISYLCSMKLRALFSLILLNTDDETGISTESLSLALWPDKDVNGSKNIRGVTINRLRNILKDIDGISLVHQNHKWFFIFQEPFYCDWLEYSGILKILPTAKKEQYNALMEQLMEIVGNGIFLVSVNDSGIDSYKSKEEERLGKLLREYITHLYDNKQYKKVISTASTFFTIEPLNENILDICVKSYGKLGKKEDAKAFLKSYKKTHKIMTGEEYKEF